MSRVLKFRAWDGERMRTDFFQLCAYDDGCQLCHYDEPQDWPVMQFTGLTDSEGVNIYEGDIVSGTKPGRGSHRTGVIEYSPMCFCINTGVTGEKLKRLNGMKVIGNIHEHPELQEGDR